MPWRKLSPGRAKLAASLGFNFLAKLPAILAVFLILPLISRSLGPATYGEFLSAMALGSVCALPFGGINTVGRRLLAMSHGSDNKAGQADAFMTTTVLAVVLLVMMSVFSYASGGRNLGTSALVVVSLLPIVSAFLNTSDNMRASFNEHYITANLQLASQICIYGAVLLIGLPQGGVVLSGLVLQAPYAVASFLTLVMLVLQRPYLLSGKVRDVRGMAIPALGVVMADGSLTALLNFSVYWLGRAGQPEFAAWDGTFVRLFQSFMSPVLLILFPLTSYIAIHWQGLARERKLLLHRLFILTGMGYGTLVGLTMAVGGTYYIRRMFHIPVEGDVTDILAISLFMGAVIAQKSYTLLLYSISEARRVSFGTAGVVVFGFCCAAFASFLLPPQKTVDVLFITTGTLLPLLLLTESFLQRRLCSKEVAAASA
jgi:O-antigen/teichoic acid export membrane protein